MKAIFIGSITRLTATALTIPIGLVLISIVSTVFSADISSFTIAILSFFLIGFYLWLSVTERFAFKNENYPAFLQKSIAHNYDAETNFHFNSNGFSYTFYYGDLTKKVVEDYSWDEFSELIIAMEKSFLTVRYQILFKSKINRVFNITSEKTQEWYSFLGHLPDEVRVLVLDHLASIAHPLSKKVVKLEFPLMASK